MVVLEYGISQCHDNNNYNKVAEFYLFFSAKLVEVAEGSGGPALGSTAFLRSISPSSLVHCPPIALAARLGVKKKITIVSLL